VSKHLLNGISARIGYAMLHTLNCQHCSTQLKFIKNR